LEVAKHKLQAAILRKEAINELDQMKKTQPSEDEDEEVRRAWDEKQGAVFTKLPLAQRGMETREDVAAILASWKGKGNNQ
jgi:hypothetical protein